MRYTVQQLAKAAGISVRTLHYYDEIGLLTPSSVRSNGYRMYEGKELIRLQQILFFRELEFSLADIKKIMNDKTYDQDAVLVQQRKLLGMKKTRVEQLIATIDRTRASLKGGEIMSTDDVFDGFDEKQVQQYQEEAKKRWGDSDAYKQSAERTKHWTREDHKRIYAEGRVFTKKLAEALENGVETPVAQTMIAEHYKSIQQFFDCSLEMYRGISELYVTDSRYGKYYESIQPGLAEKVRDAIVYYCDNHV